MVAKKHKMINHSPGRNGPLPRTAGVLVALILLMASAERAGAQNFVNHGKITNTGTLRVKNQAVGITDTLKGTFELFGINQVNQTVPATQYDTLMLNGSGSSYLSAGNIAVMKVVTIAPAVTLQVPVNAIMTLGSASGRLIENGYFTGKIQKSVDLSVVNADTSFGGIGASISWSGPNPGVTTVARTSGSSIFVGPKKSIQRFYDIQPSTAGRLNATLKFSYSNNELAGANPSALELWRSPDNGGTWRRQRIVRNGTTLSRSGLQAFGRWTAADTTNLLGFASYEWEADSLRLLAGNNQIARVRRVLDTAFAAIVTDAYGQPVVGQSVTFTVSQKPLNATGDSLTVMSGLSDSLGHVQTFLKLGSAKGDYYVQAAVPGVSSALALFHAFARPEASILNALTLANANDSVRSLVGPIAVKATDSTGTGIQGVQINFAVSSAPDTVGAYHLSNSTISTDSAGFASTNLTLGTKIGPYLVTATSPDVDPVVTRQFLVNALPGAVAKVNYAGGGIDTVTALKRLSVQVLDSYGNPRRNDTVLFALTNRPAGSTLDSLYASTALTDSNGYAATTLRLGQKSGSYVVSASVKNQPRFNNLFTTIARNLAPVNMLANVQTVADTINAVLQLFRVRVSDKFDNSVGGTNVAFAISQRPDTSSGGSLSTSTMVSDSLAGQASTVFTAGDKVGTYTIHASAGQLGQDINVQVSAGRPAIFAGTGLYQSNPILQRLDSAIVVTLTDRKANPLANLPVRFALIQKPLGAVGENLSITNSVTNALGSSSTKLTLGNKTGLYIVAAFSDSLKGVVRTFTGNATNSAAFALDSIGGQYQNKPILTTLDTAFVINVTDRGGNPVPGILVNFAIAGKPSGTSRDSLTRSSDTTDANGKAFTYLRFGTKVGAYTVVATSPNLPAISRRFYANAVNGSAFAMQSTGAGQRKTPSTQLDSAFVVAVNDLGGNPVPNTPVQFRIANIPTPFTIGQLLSDTVVSTDANGKASTRFTLGNQVGRYVVTASVSGSLIDSLSASAFLVIGDANEDASFNIGDLTQVIDHILGRLTLSASDSAAADVNTDGVINIQDAILIRDRLLTGNWSQHVVDSILVLARPFTDQQLTKVRLIPNQISADTTGASVFALGNELEVTENGLRVNLSNNQPVKGLQYVIRMKNPPLLKKPDVIYDRAKMMTILMFRTDTTLNIIAYNLDNSPITAGEGSIFRLPIPASRIADVDTLNSVLIVSLGASNRVVTMPFMNVKRAIGVYPLTYKLEQNYPNPFNGSTIIYYEVPDVPGKLARVTLQVFNILGEKVRTLVKEDKQPGRYFIAWDGMNDNGQKTASGSYFYRLVTKDFQTVKKMLLIK